MQYLKSIVPVALILLLGIASSAQQPDAKSPAVDDAFVQKQFGLTCKTVAGPQPMVADLDGDGIPDLVLVAHCGNPLLDEAEYKFQVVDPYNTFLVTVILKSPRNSQPKIRWLAAWCCW